MIGDGKGPRRLQAWVDKQIVRLQMQMVPGVWGLALERTIAG